MVFTHPSSRYGAEFQRRHLPRLVRDVLSSGAVRLELAILPMRKYPESALVAAVLACGASEGRALLFLEAVTDDVPSTVKEAEALARSKGANAKEFRACLDGPGKDAATKQAALAAQLGVTLIPTFVLDEERRVGLMSEGELVGWISSQLSWAR